MKTGRLGTGASASATLRVVCVVPAGAVVDVGAVVLVGILVSNILRKKKASKAE